MTTHWAVRRRDKARGNGSEKSNDTEQTLTSISVRSNAADHHVLLLRVVDRRLHVASEIALSMIFSDQRRSGFACLCLWTRACVYWPLSRLLGVKCFSTQFSVDQNIRRVTSWENCIWALKKNREKFEENMQKEPFQSFRIGVAGTTRLTSTLYTALGDITGVELIIGTAFQVNIRQVEARRCWITFT